MHYLIYISTSVRLMDQDDLIVLLNESRSRNIASEITGLLIYSEGTFIQALEGDKKDVDLLYASIQKDLRHKNLIEIVSGEQEKHSFPDWSMAFIAPNADKMQELQGYINPVYNKLFVEDEHSTVINVMKAFADNNGITHSKL